jgi:LmbE family N-acetylglucosaminyl deacetylase
VNIVVVSPHRDDAAFSLGLSIRGWQADGHAVSVVNCFTRSIYAPFSDAESLHSNDRMSYVTALRLREDELWRRQYGQGMTLTDLRLKDAPIRLRCSTDELSQIDVGPADKAIEKIRRALGGLSLDALVLPLAFGNHVDHRTARDAAIACSTDVLPTAFYEDLPYVSRIADLSQIETSAQALDRELAPVYSPFDCPSNMEEAVATKLRIALCYDSQIDTVTAQAIANFSRHYGGRERLWATRAWRDSNLGIEKEKKRKPAS